MELLPSKDRVVMISGANRGIGRAIAERLYADGFRLSLGAREIAALEPLIDARSDANVFCHRYDALDVDSPRRWVAATHERFGRIDALVNNAGVAHDFDIEHSDEAELDEMWAVNVKGPLRLTRAAFPHLKAAGSGRVVNIVSLSGKRMKSAVMGGYTMSKHAAAALTHATRYSGWEHGIRATAICPGPVATDMTAGYTAMSAAEMTPPASVAHLVASVLALPNNASVVEIPVNCVLEATV